MHGAARSAGLRYRALGERPGSVVSWLRPGAWPRSGGLALAAVLLLADPAHALTAAEVYEQACATCHGDDGRGPPSGSRLEPAPPDFTDCTIVTAETTANWVGLVRYGGPFLGLSPSMPSFGDSLSDAEIDAVIGYLRAFCRDARYPIGDLNFRRPVFVQKAFPEDEAVVAFEPESGPGEKAYAVELSVEKRLGPRGWVELGIPIAVVDAEGEPRRSGVGDVTLAYRQALVVAPQWRSVVSAGLELALPTGNRRNGVGTGTTVVSPQLLSAHGLGPFVLQTAVTADLPGDPARAARQMVYGFVLQLPLGPYKKSLVPAVELEQAQALDSDVRAATVLGPSLYVPLSRRGHVALGMGAQLPVAGARPFDWRVGAFVLWEYRDGPPWAW
jgi:mono/diheme cytochrome c family protein